MRCVCFNRVRKILLLTVVLLGRGGVDATVITVTTNDNYSKIESANPGDEVVITPGTYRFRVYLTKAATATNPIVIRAQDPANPPMWDFGTNLLDNAPGSYTAGDKARGGWQFSGAVNYSISGIVFRNCRNAAKNSAGIRYYSGTTNLYIKDCLFAYNDDGLTGGTEDSEATVEYCEFNANGNTNAPASSPTHNIYVYGGYLTLRYCYVHDSAQAQNFHIRCRNSTLEYNWFARAKNYDGDLMTDDDFDNGTVGGPFTQTMTLRGNVIVQNSQPGNHSQVIALYNDEGYPGLTLTVRALYNTFVGVNTNSAFVHVSNADGTQMSAEVSDNIIYGTRTPVLIEDTGSASVTGLNNWLPTNAVVAPLTGSIQSASPGFRNSAVQDFTLAPGSACINAANALVYGLPGREYYLNEITNRFWRPRAAAHDLGALESTSTAAPVGPYDPPPRPQLSIVPADGNLEISWPLFAQDFQLFESDPGNPLTWSLAPFGYSTNATAVAATVSINSGVNFFRLQK